MSKMLFNVIQARSGGAVERAHGIRHQGSYSNAMHQWGVAMLLYYLYPEDFPRLAAHALFHDVGESWFGDIPAPTMRYVPGIAQAIHTLEGNACAAIGLPREDSLNDEDHAKIKNCDRLELLIWCKEQISSGNLYAAECAIEVTRYIQAQKMDDRATALFRDIIFASPMQMMPKQAGIVEQFVKDTRNDQA